MTLTPSIRPTHYPIKMNGPLPLFPTEPALWSFFSMGRLSLAGDVSFRTKTKLEQERSRHITNTTQNRGHNLAMGYDNSQRQLVFFQFSYFIHFGANLSNMLMSGLVIFKVLKLYSPIGSCNFYNFQDHSYLLIMNCAIRWCYLLLIVRSRKLRIDLYEVAQLINYCAFELRSPRNHSTEWRLQLMCLFVQFRPSKC